MKKIRIELLACVLTIFLSVNATSQNSKGSVTGSETKIQKKQKQKKKRKKVKLSNIDLSHWKVTIPMGSDKAIEVGPPDIINYANNETLKPFMYNDSTSGAIVFHAYPNATTANTKYSRSELREQMIPGDNSKNWTFEEGGIMRGKLAMQEVTKDSKGKYHRVIIMQIHGRLTNEQRDLIGQKDNNAPPILKIYWQDGKIRVKTKVLKNLDLKDNLILHKEAWGDDKGFNFEQEVGFRKFEIEVKASKGKLVVSLNNNEFKVYKNVHMERWGIFENYFKAGNYFQSKDKGSFAKVKYFELEVKH